MWIAPAHPETPDAPTRDMAITVGWNTAKAPGIRWRHMDQWDLRFHQRAIKAIDDGVFSDEIVPLEITGPDGTVTDFTVDEYLRRDTTIEGLESLPVLHLVIDRFSVTAGKSSGTDDAAAALVVTGDDVARAGAFEGLGPVGAWSAAAVEPKDTGLDAIHAIGRVLTTSSYELNRRWRYRGHRHVCRWGSGRRRGRRRLMGSGSSEVTP